jgi:isoleucyl-tRNA synthetase
MGMYEPVDLKVDFIKQEHDVLRFWESQRIFETLRERNRGKKHWSFIDGPITANNPMGVHHAWGRTYKDVFQRYKAMQGFDQRYQNGFDCQGLWLEVETERELGFNSKQDIENFGLDNFSRACRARVEKYSARIAEQSKRLGQWMDWDNSYFTMTDTNIESIWHFLGACHEKGWLRMGNQVMPWCTRCGTSLSQHELSDSYQDIDDTSVFVGFPLRAGVRRDGAWMKDLPAGKTPSRTPGENERLLVWTTTPWTLTSNVAAAVNPELPYSRVAYQGKIYYLSSGVVDGIFKGQAQVLEEIPGFEMVGWAYDGPFDDLPAQAEVEHVVIAWDMVGEAEGSGIVHIAPGCGAEDCELGQTYGLPALAPLDERGIYLQPFGWLAGMDVHDVEKPIFEDLKKKDLFVRHETYQHRYPFCWRCKDKLVFRMEKEWFIKSEEARPLMKEAARKVRWIPESVGKRTQDWYENMGDWCISRKRFWGLPLPFYVCPAGHLTLVTSKADLRARAVDPAKVDALPELHRPWIDEIKVKCAECGAVATRILDVGDCWLDAGIVAFSTLKYFEDREYWKKWFPAELVSEMREQVRLWFYAMMFTGVTLEGQSPYLTVHSYEKVFDEKGNPMHKSSGNAIWFDDAAEKMGADVMRWVYTAANPNINLRFGYHIADDTRRRLITLWNVYSFLVTYADIDGFDPSKDADPALLGKSPNPLDRWIVSAIYQLVRDIHAGLADCDTMMPMREADGFLEKLSTWYVRRSRRRFWKSEGDEDKHWAYHTLFHVMVTFCRAMAPVLPFVTDVMFRNLTGPARAAGEASVLKLGWEGAATPASVHLTPYPEERPDLVDQTLNEAMDFVLRAVSLGRAAREKARAKVRQPLAKLWLVPIEGSLPFGGLDPALAEDLLQQIREELNVKEIDLTATDAAQFGEQKIKLNFPVLGKKYGKAMKELSAQAASGAYEIGTDGRLRLGTHVLDPEEFELTFEGKGELSLAHDRYTMAVLDTAVSAQLRLEGWAREVIRGVQDLRKKADYQVEDRIVLSYEISGDGAPGGADPKEILEIFGAYIQSETLADTVEIGKSDRADQGAEVILDKGLKVWVGVRRV